MYECVICGESYEFFDMADITGAICCECWSSIYGGIDCE